VQGIDGRAINELSTRAWHQVIGDLEFGAALAAAQSHYREEHRFVMPNDLVERVRQEQYRAEQIAKQTQWALDAEAEWCRKAGVTVEEYRDHRDASDLAWISARDKATWDEARHLLDDRGAGGECQTTMREVD
jgi:hypothetical protein